MDGILVILKPPGMTSHDVVAGVRRRTGQRQVGHLGTLDPGAAGILVLCLGKATRLIPFMEDYVKGYRAELRLGWSTDTQDAGGKLLEENRDSQLAASELAGVVDLFRGEIQQIPPMVSALKHKGQRLYELARQGKVVERKPRTIRIYELRPVGTWGPGPWLFGDRLLFDVTCSKGTYIRTLCQDMGTCLGVPTHMSFLLRTRVGPWGLQHATTLEEFTNTPQNGLFPMDKGVGHLHAVVVSWEGARRLQQGARAMTEHIADHLSPNIDTFTAVGNAAGHEHWLRMYDVEGGFLGIGRRQKVAEQGWEIQPVRMLPLATD